MKKYQKVSNIIINVLKPLCDKYNVSPTFIDPEIIAALVGGDVPMFEIKRFITDRFECIEKDKELASIGIPSEMLDVFDKIELNNILKRYEKKNVATE